ncbi:MAG: hypothetical protein HC862_20955 [Scytonema sp. RU_4_4]|nr:hypothetical protein [Scytonema sp. RU_4_4]NJR74521.1 hypothetical protein [Scytonema sp. CRU_2_7]
MNIAKTRHLSKGHFVTISHTRQTLINSSKHIIGELLLVLIEYLAALKSVVISLEYTIVCQ